MWVYYERIKCHKVVMMKIMWHRHTESHSIQLRKGSVLGHQRVLPYYLQRSSITFFIREGCAEKIGEQVPRAIYPSLFSQLTDLSWHWLVSLQTLSYGPKIQVTPQNNNKNKGWAISCGISLPRLAFDLSSILRNQVTRCFFSTPAICQQMP